MMLMVVAVMMVTVVVVVAVVVLLVVGVVEHMWDPQPLRPPLPGLGTGSPSRALTPGSAPQPSPPLPLTLHFSASPCRRPHAECPHEDLATQPAASPCPPPSRCVLELVASKHPRELRALCRLLQQWGLLYSTSRQGICQAGFKSCSRLPCELSQDGGVQKTGNNGKRQVALS